MDSLDSYCAYRPLRKYIEKGAGDYRPFTFGNQYYVVSEQNVRHVQESVALSIGMLTPSGEVMLISPTQHSTLFTVLLNHVQSQRAIQNQAADSAAVAAMSKPTTATPINLGTTPATRPNEPMSNPLTNFNFPYYENLSHQTNVETKPTAWNVRDAETEQFPSCSKSTSCSELRTANYAGNPSNQNFQQKRDTMSTANINVVANEASQSLNNLRCPFCSRLSARKQLKLRKLLFEDDFPCGNETNENL